jgi:hypothetical protein
MTLPVIGNLLGHTQVQTTRRYTHRLDEPLRAGLEQIGDMLRVKARRATSVRFFSAADFAPDLYNAQMAGIPTCKHRFIILRMGQTR